jgi:serine/threonine-protein kinase RsbW
MEPSAGVSELLRQSYDQLFTLRTEAIPVYFAFTRNEITAVSAAIEFLNAFLQQYVAFRRNEPSLCYTAVTLHDLVDLAPPADLEWISQLVESYKTLRFSNDDKALVRFCLGAPQRVPAKYGRPFVMLDGAQLADELNGSVTLGPEVLRVFGQAGLSFLLAGLRRQILKASYDAKCNFETLDVLRLEQLSIDEARVLVEHVARRQQVPITEEGRDLLIQQCGNSPFFITKLLHAAREKTVKLTTYVDCQRLYVDELMGGQVERHFADLLEEIAPDPETRHGLIRLLWEAAAGDKAISSIESFGKRLNLGANQLEAMLRKLHMHEFVNWNGVLVEAGGGPQIWKDYLKVRYRLDVMNEPRVLVVAHALMEALKRAPRTMARHYKQKGSFGLRDLLAGFDLQRVPAILFDSARFRHNYRGATPENLVTGLEAETELAKLPQVVHVASCMAFNSDLRQVCEEGLCAVAHGFDEAIYTDTREVVWLAAELESKLEVDADLAEVWCERLENLARNRGFKRYKIWLISEEGFSDNATEVVNRYQAFTSNRQQLELLAGRIGEGTSRPAISLQTDGEFLIVVPMGEDNELIAASAVEQVARRLNFQPTAINQIKTAIVEACINASEHSFSPDRKIYQRFRVESDRLVITISSRGIVPSNLGGNQGTNLEIAEAGHERRGWGLKLIKTLMDEVEFERVDEGTSLRMTKYLRKSSA